MGAGYYRYLERISGLLDQSGACIVEIGSERGEGSTLYLAAHAREHGVPFFSVDLTDRAALLRREIPEGGYEFAQESGESFLSGTFVRRARSEGLRIAALCLDNFDWNWDTDPSVPGYMPHRLEKLRTEYRAMGLEFCNVHSTNAHLGQVLAAEPFFADDALVIIDDTWRLPQTDTYVGKGGAAVHYLMVCGWRVLHEASTKPAHFAVVLERVAGAAGATAEVPA